MKIWSAFLIGLLIVLGPDATYGDVIAPGQRGVNYCFRINNLDKYPDHVFIVYYTFPSYNYTIIKPNDCIRFYHLSQPTLCAIKKKLFKEEAIKRFADKEEAKRYFETTPAFIRSGIKISAVSSMPESMPVTSVEDVLKITKLSGNALTIKYDNVVYRFADGSVERKAYTELGNRPLPSPKHTKIKSTLPAFDSILLITGSVAMALLFWVTKIRNRT